MILSDQFYHSSQQKHLLWATIKTTKISRIEQPTSLICLSQRIIYFNYNNSVTTNFATVPEFTITSWKRHYNKNPDLQKQEKKSKLLNLYIIIFQIQLIIHNPPPINISPLSFSCKDTSFHWIATKLPLVHKFEKGGKGYLQNMEGGKFEAPLRWISELVALKPVIFCMSFFISSFLSIPRCLLLFKMLLVQGNNNFIIF